VKALRAWEERPPRHPQRELIFLLRTVFADCLPSGLLEALRSVRWQNDATAVGEVQHGKRSTGKSIESTFTGTAALPEEVTFVVPVWGNAFGWTAPVRLALEIHPDAGAFQLVPLPGQLERAIASAEERLGDELKAALEDSQVPVHYGAP
jgi:hypothetical protein